MHELLTIGKPDLFELMRGDIAPLSEWAKSAIKSKKNKKAVLGDRDLIIPKYHWEKLAAHFGVQAKPGLPVDAVAAMLGDAVGITVTMLRNTYNNAWLDASPELPPPPADEAAARSVAFSIAQWNAMFPNFEINAEAQRATAGVEAYPVEAECDDY